MNEDNLIEILKLIPIYLLYIGTFGLASLEKFRSGGMPDWFGAQFEKTFLNLFSGSLKIQYYFIAVLEAVVAVLFLISAVTGEFLPGATPIFLRWALLMALFAFFALGIGLRIGGDYQGAANLFAYFGVTFLISIYVEKFLVV